METSSFQLLLVLLNNWFLFFMVMQILMSAKPAITVASRSAVTYQGVTNASAGRVTKVMVGITEPVVLQKEFQYSMSL